MIPVPKDSVNSLFAVALLLLALLPSSSRVAADSLDEGVQDDAFLFALADELAVYDIDVTSNLNARELVRQRIQRPRLGRFPDLELGRLPSTEEINNWEAAYLESELGGLAVLLDTAADTAAEAFSKLWLDSTAEQRLFVTFYKDDLEAVENLRKALAAHGHASNLHFAGASVSAAAQFYATAAQRLAIDSRAARRYRTDVSELDYLGERVRRRSNSLFVADGNRGDGSLSRREPSVFLKETLGDEFNQSTIEAIIVPGGVALGETASLDIVPRELVYQEGELYLLDEQGISWSLPEILPSDAKALFDQVLRSEAVGSDAIVDIDADGRVRISSALRDTDVGYAIMHADTQPFEFVPNLPVTKSVVIDMGVDWQQVAREESLQFAVDYEVRFLSADNMRIAQTRAALEYQYDNMIKTSEYSDSWGRDVRRLDDNLDYSGLGLSMAKVATYAGWIGLFRRLHEDEVRFLRGRYEFMKIDKLGEKTPIRY